VIVRSTIDLARNLGLRAIAEGAESAEIVALLTAMDCDLIQGYHVCRPLEPDAITLFLRDEQ